MRKLSCNSSWLRQLCSRCASSSISLFFHMVLTADQALWRLDLGFFGLIFTKSPRICPDKIRHSAASRYRACSSSVGCPVLGGSSLRERASISDTTDSMCWFSRLVPEAERLDITSGIHKLCAVVNELNNCRRKADRCECFHRDVVRGIRLLKSLAKGAF